MMKIEKPQRHRDTETEQANRKKSLRKSLCLCVSVVK
jgi:hypothetical protein